MVLLSIVRGCLCGLLWVIEGVWSCHAMEDGTPNEDEYLVVARDGNGLR